MAARLILFTYSWIILGYFISAVQSEHFEFGDGQQPCILLDIDATFDLSRGAEKADPFSIEGANITKTSSLCGAADRTAILSLSVFPSDEQFKINFRRDVNTQTVSMSVALQLDPKKHFENASEILPFELEDSDDLPIGMMNMSYKCYSPQQILFNQDPGYSMTMTITDLQVQAYSIQDGAYSPALECEQDLLTTEPTTAPSPEPTTASTIPTTTMDAETTPEMTTNESPATMGPETTTPETPATIIPETTSKETNVTSPEPEPVTPTQEPETTTSSEPATTTPPKVIPKYEVKDGNTTCIVVKGEIMFNIVYEKNDNQTGEAVIAVPEEVKVSGACKYNGTDTTQELMLTFFDDKWSLSVLISQDEETLSRRTGSLLRDLQAEPSYSWKEIVLTYVIDDNFEDPKESDIGQTMTAMKEEGDGDFRSSADGSYRCNTGEALKLEGGVAMDLGNFQYKAFGKDNSDDFPDNDVSACPADTGDDDDDDDHTVAIVLGSVFGGLAFIILIVAVGVCLKRRKKSNYEVM